MMGSYRHEIRLANGVAIPKFRVNLLMYPNLPGERDVPDPAAAPILLRFASGIAVWPAIIPHDERTRLPLLGMQGIREAALEFEIDAGATPMVAQMRN